MATQSKSGRKRPVNLPQLRGISKSEIKPISGRKRNLIEEYGLASFIREQRLKGKTYRAITELINSGKMLPNDYKINHSTIAKWCQEHDYGASISEQSEHEAINVYERECKMLEVINATMDMLSTKMDDMSQDIAAGVADVKEMKMMVDMVNSMSIRQQALTQDIGRLQERIYNYQLVSDCFQVISETLALELDAPTYDKVIKAITSRPALREALRPITPAGAV